MDVEHVTAHRTKKDKKKMSQFEKFVAEGNEKADELAKEGAMLNEGFMAETRAKTVQQEREGGVRMTTDGRVKPPPHAHQCFVLASGSNAQSLCVGSHLKTLTIFSRASWQQDAGSSWISPATLSDPSKLWEKECLNR